MKKSLHLLVSIILLFSILSKPLRSLACTPNISKKECHSLGKLYNSLKQECLCNGSPMRTIIIIIIVILTVVVVGLIVIIIYCICRKTPTIRPPINDKIEFDGNKSISHISNSSKNLQEDINKPENLGNNTELILINRNEQQNFEIKNNNYNGKGLRKMKSYTTTFNNEQLNKRRLEFWNSKMTIEDKNWMVLFNAVLINDYEKNIKMLNENNLLLVNGTFEHLRDDKGTEYIIPEYCVNDPYEKVNERNREDKIQIHFLDTNSGDSYKAKVKRGFKGIDVKNKYINLTKVDVSTKNIVIKFKGNNINDEDLLSNFGVKHNDIIEVLS